MGNLELALFLSIICAVRSQYHGFMAELETVKSTVEILKKEVAFEREARIDTDRELTALTERYRNLLIEHEGTKRIQPIDIVNCTKFPDRCSLIWGAGHDFCSEPNIA